MMLTFLTGNMCNVDNNVDIDDLPFIWTLSDIGPRTCIMFGSRFWQPRIYLKPDKANLDTLLIMDIPARASVSNQSSCDVAGSHGMQQILVLDWTDKDPDREDATLDRSISFHFSVNATTRHYGVSRINGVYEWRSHRGTDLKTNQTIVIKDIISFTTFTLSTWKFSVELDKSYVTCPKLKPRYCADEPIIISRDEELSIEAE